MAPAEYLTKTQSVQNPGRPSLRTECTTAKVAEATSQAVEPTERQRPRHTRSDAGRARRAAELEKKHTLREELSSLRSKCDVASELASMKDLIVDVRHMLRPLWPRPGHAFVGDPIWSQRFAGGAAPADVDGNPEVMRMQQEVQLLKEQLAGNEASLKEQRALVQSLQAERDASNKLRLQERDQTEQKLAEAVRQVEAQKHLCKQAAGCLQARQELEEARKETKRIQQQAEQKETSLKEQRALVRSLRGEIQDLQQDSLDLEMEAQMKAAASADPGGTQVPRRRHHR